MYWLQQISNLLNQPNLYFDSLNPLNKKIITHWDSEKADKQLQSLIEQYDGKLTQACKFFIKQYLENNEIHSIHGIFEFNSKSIGKLVDKMRKTKAMTVARIPEILLHGQIVEILPEDGHRKDSLNEFVTIQKILLFKTPYKTHKVKATIKVATNSNNKRIPYYLTGEKTNQFDSFHTPTFASKTSYTATKSQLIGYPHITPQNRQKHKHFSVIELIVKDLA